MKVHNDLKELLKAYDEYLKRTAELDIIDPNINATNFLTFNSLALGKPEPLAKNKQTQVLCYECNSENLRRTEYKCNDCGHNGYYE